MAGWFGSLGELFILGSVGFWILFGFMSLMVLVATEGSESFGLATTTVIAFFVLLAICGDFNVVTAVRRTPLTAGGVCAGYIVAGVLWSMVKWYLFLRERRDDYNERKALFLQEHQMEGAVIPDGLKGAWRNRIGYGHSAPHVRDHKTRIVRWMVYWPWSLLWFCVNDPVRRFFRMLFNRIVGIYERIQRRVWGDAEADFTE
ncbi:hypothetical protein HY480_00710 [Candidatus Uhrbacteria bacterium]|nr:hypothetical protein [Candidatus Uhrbacteria bacterium]